MKKAVIFFAIFMLLLAGCVSSKASDSGAVIVDATSANLWEGFEQRPFWFAVGNSWNDNDSSVEAKWNKEQVTEGKASLECEFKMNGLNGATFHTEEPVDNDWSGKKSLVVDFINTTDRDIEVALALSTGADWTWFESPTVILTPGENRDIYFSLSSGGFKCAASDWQYTAQVENLNSIRRVAFKFFADAGLEGSVIIDNLRLE
ncbi:hypothetical protein WKV44_00915 [Spirochaetia bacterium 38H-sp]|uniref:Mannanase galactose-binding domain-containing protein n=1 Tax=Rarispira pelagica TaxID=3141764 RepID=A0ABU9U8V3_9SPIR